MLPSGVVTLRELLAYVGKKINFAFMDARSGELETDLEILMNGRDFRFSDKGLETALKEDDFVEVYLLPLGGG